MSCGACKAVDGVEVIGFPDRIAGILKLLAVDAFIEECRAGVDTCGVAGILDHFKACQQRRHKDARGKMLLPRCGFHIEKDRKIKGFILEEAQHIGAVLFKFLDAGSIGEHIASDSDTGFFRRSIVGLKGRIDFPVVIGADDLAAAQDHEFDIALCELLPVNFFLIFGDVDTENLGGSRCGRRSGIWSERKEADNKQQKRRQKRRNAAQQAIQNTTPF